MKPSRYNVFYDLDNGVTLAFNSASGALAEIEKEHISRIRYLLEHPDQVESEQDREFMEGLIGGGYLVGDAIDEVAVLESQANVHRHSTATLTLTIAPTLACNFACEYCFEGRSTARMSDETQKALLEFVDNKLNLSSKMLITWFGGEPTLCMPIIERLQRGLIDLAEDHQVEMEPASIISNGYLLDGNMARRLKDIGISEVQITLDGPPEVHDRRRQLRNGKGTFNRIIENMKETADILDVGVRINVDRANADQACEVVEILQDQGLLSRVKVYFAQVLSSGGGCADIRDRCYGQEEFARSQVELYNSLMAKSIYHVEYPQTSGGVICGALSNISFVVSPTGHLFKCWEEISLDPAKSVGDIFTPETNDNQKANLAKFRYWNPFILSECRDCDILPICMGGCPIRGIEEANNSRGVCSPWKYNLRDMLEIRYQCETAREARV